jgi:protein-L-isoaspartate O-methyltransferase
MNANDMKTHFEAAAAEWDTMRLTYYDEKVIETVADAIAIDDTQTVLDVGSGTGFITAASPPRLTRPPSVQARTTERGRGGHVTRRPAAQSS